VSVCVHAFPSLQVVPLLAFGFEQRPVAVLHVPATWHWSLAVHTTGFDPVHAPAWQVSFCVQRFPSLQGVPFASGTSGGQLVDEPVQVSAWSHAPAA
jgi:hypothetical protein